MHDVEDIYPLSPLQSGILFHVLHDPGGSDYFQQLVYQLDGDLDTAAFARAWQEVTDRHSALRTSFSWQDLAAPIQVVHRRSHLTIRELDWRSVPADEVRKKLTSFLAQERVRGIDLEHVAELHRLDLLRTADRSYYAIWHHHHIVLDGWSVSIVLSEAFAIYNSLTRNDQPPALAQSTPYGKYIAWLAQQSRESAAAYWRQELAGMTRPTQVPVISGGNAGDAGGAKVRVVASQEELRRLETVARRARLTMNEILQGMWAVLLSRYSGDSDVVFGTTVAGRSFPVAGIESMVGLLINTLPTRISVDATAETSGWLGRLHQQLTGMRAYENCALVDIRKYSEMPVNQSMFDSIFIFDNFSWPDSAALNGLTLTPVAAHDQTGYPLVLSASVGDRLWIDLQYQIDRVTAADARQMVEYYHLLLRGLPAHVENRLGDLPSWPEIDTDLALRRKVDRAGLAAGGPRPGGGELVVPRSSTELALAGVWSEVLQVEQVGVHDNFFSLGGDSILAIHIMARARQAGLSVTPQQILTHQTIAELAAVVDEAGAGGVAAGQADEDEDGRNGEVPLSPIERWFTEMDVPHDHFNQSVRLEWHQRGDPALIADALAAVVGHHDALRLRLSRGAEGWRQHVADRENADLLRVVDLTAAPVGQREQIMADAATQANTSLSLADGPIVTAVLFQAGDQARDQLVVIIHHLAVDTVSWQVFLEDLVTAYRQRASGDPVVLPAKTTSFQHWARRLVRYAQLPEMAAESVYWQSVRPAVHPLPVDHASGANTQESARTVTAALPAAATRALLYDVPAAYRTQIGDILLTALVRALAPWAEGDSILIDLESHGREPLFTDVDLSRTIGWFTAVYPISLPLPAGGGDAAQIKTIKEHLRAVPHHGIGYGISRYLRGTHASTRWPGAQIVFNYHGQHATAPAATSAVYTRGASTGTERAPAGPRPYLIEIDTSIIDGEFRAAWTYSAHHHARHTITHLATSFHTHLQTLITHCTSGTSGAIDVFTERLFPGTPMVIMPMARAGVPGASIAVIADDAISSWGTGVELAGSDQLVNDHTVFQAGSVSKQISAVAALRLVQDGSIGLDDDVNRYLRSWQVPQIEPGAQVTLRQLLNHTAGLAARPDMGALADAPPPGHAGRPAICPVRAIDKPGGSYRYADCHYLVVGQLLADITGVSFPTLARTLVFDPLDMLDSSFEPDFPRSRGVRAAIGHSADSRPMEGGWRAYDGLAATGLWTTPTDLAQISLEICRAATGRKSAFMSCDTARMMLTPSAHSTYALGNVAATVAGQRWYGHPGGTLGYKCVSAFDLSRRLGLVIMTNGDSGLTFILDICTELNLDLAFLQVAPII
jgi:non-ribosomal peptide synthase protein (TIGR01720 family)